MADVRTLALALPVVFVLHVVEEAPRFVSWINDRVSPPITPETFLAVNGVAFVVTLGVSAALAAARGPMQGLVGVAWVSFVMLANGVFHLVATLAHQSYCPGVVTGVLLYLPLSALFIARVAREIQVSPFIVGLVATGGAIPMAVHGYLIVFRGSRLL